MRRNYWTTLVTAGSLAALAACQPSSQAAEVSKKDAAKAPAVSATRTLEAWRQFSMATTTTISSRTAKPGDVFTARVVADVQDAAGRVAIPAGSLVSGTITDVKSAPNPSSPGTLTLAVNSVAVNGRSYPINASIDSLATERSGRPISGSDAVKVGVGAAAGAIVGQIIGKNSKGTIIGAVVGAAAGGAYAAATKDGDISLPAGTHVLVTLTQRLNVTRS
ncbi:MAG TPA: glycine zipper domain-containing protein [Gemmatimonadales bacterium]|nr:glycine zipper domain-containing protein [Gemmatimonadales bacterium]